MSIVEKLALLRQPRLAALATSAWPAWLWSTDGTTMLWANAVGAAIFGASGTDECMGRRFDPRDTAAAQIARLAAVLPTASQERLERLRGFGLGFGGALTCACSRIVLQDRGPAVLIAAAEPAGPRLSLAERLDRLFAAEQEPIAAFAPDGALIDANAAAQARLAGATRLSALGIETLAATVFETGSGGGRACLSGDTVEVSATRLGRDDSLVLVLNWPQPETERQTAPALQDIVEPAAETAPAAEVTATEAPVAAQAAFTQTAPSEPAAVTALPDNDAERRHPLRFVWHMDADGRFGVGSDEFVALAGPKTAAAFGRPWRDIAAELRLDPDDRVERAVASRDTWSGIVVSWPVNDCAERLPVEMSGLPVFDRDRAFRGYRGFGVCRDIDRINELARMRRDHPNDLMPPPAAAVSPAPDAAAAIEVAPVTASPDEHSAPEPAPASANVVPFRQAAPEPKSTPALSPVERRAFRELAQELTARLREPAQNAVAALGEAEALPVEAAAATEALDAKPAFEHMLLDRIPVGILVYRHDAILYANRHFLDWSGYADSAAIEAAGGPNALIGGPVAEVGGGTDDLASQPVRALSITRHDGGKAPVRGRMFTVPWAGAPALALVLNGMQAATGDEQASAAAGDSTAMRATLAATSDGVMVLDGGGRVIDADGSAAKLFDGQSATLTGQNFFDLLAPESEPAMRGYFERIRGGMSILNRPVEATALGRGDRAVPLATTLVRATPDRIYAVLRDMTERRRAEHEVRNAKREAERAQEAKADFLAKVSHDIRTPLNTIAGFADVIMAERFGTIGNERYREYVKDIHAACGQIAATLNDLVDLSRVETGQIDLAFANLNLNDLIQQCVGVMQPQANRARIIIRTALTAGLPRIVADERSLRQIVLGLIGNSIGSTGPGGQVIVSTVFTDSQDAVLRIRDTGNGMSEKDIQAALEPFRDAATAEPHSGAGFSLPLAKALAAANRAHFSITSAPNAGTLIEVAFPQARQIAG